jgi:hypothetical protein
LLLINFFKLYGEVPEENYSKDQFLFSKYVISVSGKGGKGEYILVSTLKNTRPELCFYKSNKHPSSLSSSLSKIIIEDPLDLNNNVARSCFLINEIKNHFSNAYLKLIGLNYILYIYIYIYL